ncbi:MAG: type II toxin-antitoxin system PemK/MazF family toxin [Bacteroidetes bacterium]|jgi:mRNA interferase MazF|nr:type II toxin-antitoxin system PemK/MazF family toxin [Bacteroidota bacterium]MBU1578623.1 type II toxin-antitoxin system PemK/MazF family toxin [Bacteroidota bacterium]MBU2558527.1 type II toxin-antitoxin system PemK/MazF family toxin [Bacteroidota bacterium]MDA3942874.1 type II toxin-antitoxin system PemK/MazF family toxin [Bacteroidota bacterium]
MERLMFGDIVLLKFPFTDGKSFKKRPALIINDYDDGDIIVCRITSQIYDTKNDYYLDKWSDAGLKLPSVVRVHKIATLDKRLVETRMGKLDKISKKSITQIIKNLTA